MSVRFQARSLLTIFFIAAFGYIVVEAWDMPIQAKLYPWTVGVIALALLVWQLAVEVLPAKGEESDATGMDIDFTEEENSPEGRRRAAELFGWVYAYAAMLYMFGFYLTIPLVAFLYMLRHREDPILTVVLPASAGLATWGLFDNLLHLPFPPGAVFEWLGLA